MQDHVNREDIIAQYEAYKTDELLGCFTCSNTEDTVLVIMKDQSWQAHMHIRVDGSEAAYDIFGSSNGGFKKLVRMSTTEASGIH